MSFGCEHSSSPQRVSNFNSSVPQGGINPHIKYEGEPLNTSRHRALTSSGSTGSGRGSGRGSGGGAAKTIISPNTSFGDIMTRLTHKLHSFVFPESLKCNISRTNCPIALKFNTGVKYLKLHIKSTYKKMSMTRLNHRGAVSIEEYLYSKTCLQGTLRQGDTL